MDKQNMEIGETLKASNQAHYKNNRMQQIRGFCNLVVFKSVTKAAHSMGLSQPAISLQIKTLERDIGKKLVEKQGKFLVPTQDGLKFFEFVMPTLQKLDDIYDEYLTHLDDTEKNTFRIAGYYPAITRFMPKIIAELLKSMPHTKVVITQCDRDIALYKLRTGEIDAMLFNTSEIGYDLQMLKTIFIKPVILVHKNHRLTKLERELTFEDFNGERFLLIEGMQISASYEGIFKKMGIKREQIEFRNFDWEGIKFFVSEGLGISFFGAFKNNDDIEHLNIRQIEIGNLFPDIEYNLIVRKKEIKEVVHIFTEAIDKILQTKFLLKGNLKPSNL